MKLMNRVGTISAGDSEQDVAYGIEFNPFMASLLSDKLYTDKPTACWRELYANAHDESDNIQVQLPTQSEPTCIIWDNGPGLDQDELIGLFCTYGASNKRGTNSKIGGFGVGSKVLFSYTDTFSASSVKNGVITRIVCYKNNEGMPTARIVGHEASDEQTGTRIEWAVSTYDVDVFRKIGLEVFARFEHKPTFLCQTVHTWPDPYSLKTDYWAVRSSDFSSMLMKTGSGVHIVMGGIAYPVSSSSLTESNYYEVCKSDVDIFAPIGSVQLAASREALSYDDKTVAYVTRRLGDMQDEAAQLVEDEIACAVNWYEKELARERVLKPVPFLNNRRNDAPGELKVTHEVRRWGSRGGHVPTRIKLDTENYFTIDPKSWEDVKKYVESDFQDSVSPNNGGYSYRGYECVIRFPTGTTAPSGFTTRAAEFVRDKGLRSFIVIPDDVVEWCEENHVPTDHVVLWDKVMHDKYKADKADTSYVEYRRKEAHATTLYEVVSSGETYLNVREKGMLRQLAESDGPQWFLLTNSGSYVRADNPAVDGREPVIGYLCAAGELEVHLVPKSYAGVLGGNFININKEKEKFDACLRAKIKGHNMLDGYVRGRLRPLFRELIMTELMYDHKVRNGVEALMREDNWEVPKWFDRFIRVLVEGDPVHQAANHLVVDKGKASVLIQKELDMTKKRLYRKPMIFQALTSANETKHSQMSTLASKVSEYLK